MKEEIAILLAAYNGEQYIREMIESIVKQKTDVSWKLYVFDDCSRDETPSILTGFAEAYPEKICFTENEKGSGSAKKNFLQAIRKVDAPYLMFADQDDFWLPDKIEKTYRKMKEVEEPDKPCMVFCDLQVVDKDLQKVADSFLDYSDLDHGASKFERLLIQNNIPGCTSMINRRLRDEAAKLSDTEADQILMHDWYMALLASGAGCLDFLDEQKILYRVHGDNSVGVQDVRKVSYLAKRAAMVKKNKESVRATRVQAGVLAAHADKLLPPERKKLIEGYAGVNEKRYLQRLAFHLKYHIWKKGLLRKAAMIVFL